MKSQTQQIEEGFLTVPDFLSRYAVSRTSFYRDLVGKGQLKLHKIGRASRIARADARAWADSLPTIGGGQ